ISVACRSRLRRITSTDFSTSAGSDALSSARLSDIKQAFKGARRSCTTVAINASLSIVLTCCTLDAGLLGTRCSRIRVRATISRMIPYRFRDADDAALQDVAYW